MKKKELSQRGLIEILFEGTIWRTRFIVVLAVIFGLVGAVILFIVASYDIASIAGYAYQGLFAHPHPEKFHENIVAVIIGAVDLYLIAVVMFIFSFGLYELFISHIDEAGEQILAITSLDQLKDKIAKVIVMVLVVNFFQRVLYTDFTKPIEMLYFAGSIAILALGLFFLGKVGKH